MATRAKIDVANLIHTDEEWAASIEKPGLKVVDVYAQWAGPCEAIQTIFKTIKIEHGDNISFLQVSADSIEALSKYRGKSCPTFMFFFDDILVKIITGANSPLIEKTIKEQLDLQANGQIHVPLILDIESALGNSAQKQVAPAEGISTSPSSELRKSGTTRTNDPAVDGAIEYTLGFIKPDAMHPSIIGQILDVIKRNRIEVVKKKKVWLSKEQAEEFYKEHKGVDWFPNLVRFVSSAPILVLELAKENAVQAWRQVIGPTSTKRAREENPKCIRALFGTDNLMNAVFGSSSPESAKFELDFFFHSNSSSPSPMLEIPFTDTDTESRGTSLQKTLLFLKPDVVGVQGSGGGEAPSGNSKTVEEIVEIILWRGYQIIKREDFVITQETAVELFEMYGEEVWYDELIDFVCSAPTLAFVLKGENVIKGIYELAGPMNPEEAREKFPMSLRARYGTSIVQNAVHCPSTVEDAIRDVQILFPHISLSRHGSQLLSRFGLESTSVRGSKANIISSLRGSLRSINALNSRAISPAQGLAERTLVIVKSDAYIEEEKEVEVDNGASLEKQTRRHKLDSILAAVSKAGFKVVDAKEVQLEDSVAREFYKGHEDEANFEGLISSITRGPIYVAVLEKNSAINSWKELIGPNNPTMAKENAPSSLRAKFGTDDANNGLHGSDSPADAEREIELFFGDSVSPFADGYKPEVAPRAGLISHTASYHSLNNVKPIPIIPEEIPAPAAITAALESSMAATKVEPEEEIQRTLALIKPDAYGAGKKDEIVAIIKSSGFTIVKEAEVKWDLETAKKFYKEHEGKSFYNDLTTWMSSAPIYTLVLEKAGAIKAWRALAGPTNSLKAKEEAPNSIRALFGTDGTYNAVHGSDSPESAEREIQIVSTEQVPVVEETAVPVPAANVEAVVEVEGPVQQTLALIKPDAYGAGKKDEIIEKIKQRGFTIIQEKELQLSVNDAKEFYKEHEGKGFYEELTTWMSSAPIYAMVLEKVNGISAWRELAGPTNSNTARESAPESIRALYGKDGSENAVHGSDSVESAAREIAIIFKAAPAAEEKIPTRPPSKPSSRPESPNKSRRTSAVATGETAPIGSSRISVRSKVPSKPTISRTASQAGSIRPVLSKPASQASITKTASQAAVSKTPSQASMKPPLSKPASKATIPKPASGLGSKAPSRMSSKAELGKTPSQANVVKSAAGSKPVSRTQSQNL